LVGNEFTVLLQDVCGLIDAELVAQKILTLVREPFVLEGRVLHVTTTIGAALGDRAVHTSRELIEAADSALYRAKEAGRDTYAANSLTRREKHQMLSPHRIDYRKGARRSWAPPLKASAGALHRTEQDCSSTAGNNS